MAAWLAIGGALAVLACLFVFPWWSGSSCYSSCTFQGLSDDWLERYDFVDTEGAQSERPTSATEFGAAFFRWGQFAFALAAVAGAVAIRARPAWPLGIAAAATMLGAFWLAITWSEVGIINTTFVAYLAYIGAAAIAVAAGLRVWVANQAAAPQPAGVG